MFNITWTCAYECRRNEVPSQTRTPLTHTEETNLALAFVYLRLLRLPEVRSDGVDMRVVSIAAGFNDGFQFTATARD